MNIKSIGSKIKGNPKMVEGTVYSMLIICSISHFLNDMIQSIIPSIYPIVKDKFDFSFGTDRYHHTGLPDDIFHLATFHRTLCR